MSDPVSILFTIPNFITAGSGRAMLDIIERLDRRRFTPGVCVLQKGGMLDGFVERMGIPFLEVPFVVAARPLHSLLLRLGRASRPFRAYRFGLWHSFHYLDDYTEPIIARLAGARAWVYTKKNMSWNRRSWYLRTWLATGVAVQNTDMMRDFFGTGRFRRKRSLIPRGVDTGRYSPDVPKRLSLRQRLGVADRAIVVGCVARLMPLKAHPTLLSAVAGTPGVYLWLAGGPLDTEYAESLKHMVHRLDLESRVTFLGEVGDVPAFLAEVDIAVLPSRREGCPVALLEAMASARACVATDVPGSRDIVQHGKDGLLVPAEDANALADAFRRLASQPDLRRGLGAAARARVLENFTIEREVKAHEAMYSALLFGEGGTRKPAA